MPSLAGIPVAIAIASVAATASCVSAFATTIVVVVVVVPIRTHAPVLLREYLEMVYDKRANTM